MNSTVPRFPRDPVIIGRVIGPETYDPRSKPGIEVRDPEKKSGPFASAVRRFDEKHSAHERSLGPGAYDPNYNSAFGAAGLIAIHEPQSQSSPFASNLARFNQTGMGKGPEPTPPPYFNPALEDSRWKSQPSLAAAWGKAERFDYSTLNKFPARPDYYNLDASTAVARMSVLSPLVWDYQKAQAEVLEEIQAQRVASHKPNRHKADSLKSDFASIKRGAVGAGTGYAPPSGAPPLDFSFQEHSTIESILDESPVEDIAGRLPHKVTLAPPPEIQERLVAATAAAAAVTDGSSAVGSNARRKQQGGVAPTQAASAADELEAPPDDVRYVAKVLRVNNNQIRDLAGLPSVLNQMVLKPSAMVGIDLSSNQIVTLGDECFSACPMLHSLLLHDNKLVDLAQLRCVPPLLDLRRLSVYGNPVADATHGLRMLLLAAMPALKSLDASSITVRERTDAIALADSVSGRRALKPLKMPIRLPVEEAVQGKRPGTGTAPEAANSHTVSHPISR